MALDFEGKIAMVTGGGQGIGRATTRLLHDRGACVLVAERDETAGREVEALFRETGRVRFVPTDVADEAQVTGAVEAAVRLFGGLDLLVNNAGIADPGNAPVESLALEAWERVIRTNLTGFFLCAKHAVPYLRERGGSIVNIASTRAAMSEPHTEAYAASKGGVVSLTHALAVSLGPAVRVNCISPGWIDVRAWKKGDTAGVPPLRAVDHAQHPVGRVGRPEDVAELVAYLASPAAGFITGQNLTVDGGMTRKMIYEF